MSERNCFGGPQEWVSEYLVAMKRVFGAKKDKTPAPTVEEATERVSFFSLFFFFFLFWFCANYKPAAAAAMFVSNFSEVKAKKLDLRINKRGRKT